MRPHTYAIVVTLVASICQVTAQDSESRTTSLEAKVDGYLKPYLETGNFSGSVLIDATVSHHTGGLTGEGHLYGPDKAYIVNSDGKTVESVIFHVPEVIG